MSGFDKIENLISSLEQIERTMPVIVIEEMDKVLDLMAELNRDQLRKGENPQGQDLASIRPYAPATVAAKRAKGQPASKVTFLDEGNLYSRLTAKKYDIFVELSTDVPQTPELISKWGEFEGLSDVHMEMVQEELKPHLLFRVKQILP